MSKSDFLKVKIKNFIFSFTTTKYIEIKKIKSPTKVSKQPSYIQSVYKVLFADITISFDNVIGVVGAAKGNFGFMVFGLVLSVVLTEILHIILIKIIKNNEVVENIEM